jgi:hypothetical protein
MSKQTCIYVCVCVYIYIYIYSTYTCHTSLPMCVPSDAKLHVNPSTCLSFLKLGGVKWKLSVLCQIFAYIFYVFRSRCMKFSISCLWVGRIFMKICSLKSILKGVTEKFSSIFGVVVLIWMTFGRRKLHKISMSDQWMPDLLWIPSELLSTLPYLLYCLDNFHITDWHKTLLSTYTVRGSDG